MNVFFHLMDVWRDIWMCEMNYECATELMNVRQHSRTCGITHECVVYLRDLWMFEMNYECATWFIHMWQGSWKYGITHECATWIINAWHHSIICVAWLVHVSHEYVMWLGSKTYHMDVWHDSVIRHVTHKWVIPHVWVVSVRRNSHITWMCDVTR